MSLDMTLENLQAAVSRIRDMDFSGNDSTASFSSERDLATAGAVEPDGEWAEFGAKLVPGHLGLGIAF